MHLKSLVLKGFKSFADRSVMSFEPGITAIVGPNGSGKSNVSDAVLWVLGERNARNLRGQAMEDVIFSGSSARKPVGMAEVELVLDNSDGTLPVEFDEVSLARRMYRNGESEYLINGVQARRMDVLDILHDSGLGTGTHSIIGQGQLSSILQSKPEDRRALIEEAAGVLKHKQRKEKSERKLASMDGHLTRVQDIVNEVQRQVKPLERKAKKALAHRDASEELAVLELDLAVDDLRILQGRWDETLKAEQAAELSAAQIHETIQDREKKAQALQETLREYTSGAGEASQRHRRAQAALDKIDSSIMLFLEKKRSSVNYLAEMRVSLENDIRSFEAARDQSLSAQGSLKETQREFDEAAKRLDSARREADGSRRRQRELQQEIDKLSHRRRDVLSNLEDERAVLARVQEVLANNRAQSQMMEVQAKDLEARVKDAEDVFAVACEQAASAKSDLEAGQLEEAEVRKAIGEAHVALESARSSCDNARSERSACDANVKGLVQMQKARRAQNPLLSAASSSEVVPAVPLVQLVSASPEMEPVLEHLLGRDVDSLFVDDAQAALALSKSMKDAAESGLVTLLARKAEAESHVQLDGKRLLDCVTCDESVAGSLQRLLGDVYVFDNMEQAHRFSISNQQVICASKDGFVFWSNGKITCRHPRKDESGELADYRELEKARLSLKQAEAAFAESEKAMVACEARFREAQSKGLETSQRVAQMKGALQSAEKERSRAESQRSVVLREKDKLATRRAQVEAALSKAEPDVEAHEARVRVLEQEAETLKGQIDSKRLEITPLRTAADKAASDLSDAKLASATCSERLAYAKRMLEACERDMRKAETQMGLARTGIARKEASLQRIDPMVDLLTRLSASAKKREGVLAEEAIRSQSASESLHGSINDARAQIREAYGQYDAKTQLLADIRVEKSKIEMQVEAAISTIVDDCATPLETAIELPKLEDRPQTEEQAQRLRKKIAGMGAINPDAASEYEKLKERYDYLSSQLEDMLAARRSLTRIVRAIDERMKDDFAKTFDVVNANFQEIFAELFPGGSGSLSLVDPEDLENTGVEVGAQPPGKRILKMSLMSGGEKSLTALALLFAVYKTRATPFYILDEVEAALDDTNLRRLVAYLNTMRIDSQFIIITHQRRTMEMADVLYGISMQSDGVTKVMSQRLDKALQYAEG